MLRGLLEGETVVVVSVDNSLRVSVDLMVKINRVDGGTIFTDAGFYVNGDRWVVSYRDRSVTFKGIEGLVSRSFHVVNFGGNVGSGYRPYPDNDEALRKLWLDAEMVRGFFD